jgi:hypothetical protein
MDLLVDPVQDSPGFHAACVYEHERRSHLNHFMTKEKMLAGLIEPHIARDEEHTALKAERGLLRRRATSLRKRAAHSIT